MSENEKILKARFTIPKDKIKNSNVQLNYIMSSIKSSWIRSHSEEVWAEVASSEFGVKAIEPKHEDLKIEELPEEAKETQARIESLREEFNEATEELKSHQLDVEDYKAHKKERTTLRRKKADNVERLEVLEDLISEYEEKLEVLKATKGRRQKMLSKYRASQEKGVKKAVRKTTENNKRNYIKAKIEANRFQHLFEKCYVVVTVHNIVNRDFDSPNFYPTLKPILDGATDAGIMWEDDNNSVILSTIFLSGGNLDRQNYIIDIEVCSTVDQVQQKLEEASKRSK